MLSPISVVNTDVTSAYLSNSSVISVIESVLRPSLFSNTPALTVDLALLLKKE